MATNYPGGLDSLSNPASGDPLSSPAHSTQHANANDAIEAIETELGTTPSGVYSTVAARLDAIAGAGTASISLNAGTATAPSFYFTSDTNTGIWSPGADTLAVSTGGTERLRVGSTGQLTAVLGAGGTPTYSFTGDTDTGIYSPGGDTIALVTNGTDRFVVNNVGQVSTYASTAGTPTYTFVGDTNTGLYSPGADQVGLATAGTARMVIDSAGLVTGTGTSYGAWTAYTPTLTGWTKGDGTLDFAYCRVGKTVHVRGKATLGSTSTVTGPMDITLPVTPNSAYEIGHIYNARVMAWDVSPSTLYPCDLIAISGGTARIVVGAAGGAYLTIADIGTTVPMTWASGDKLFIAATYEAA